MSKYTGILKSKSPGSSEQASRLREVLKPNRQGRPPGKRSNPDFEQVTAYIRGDTHRNVKLALLQEGKGTEFSEIIEELLSAWLKKLRI